MNNCTSCPGYTSLQSLYFNQLLDSVHYEKKTVLIKIPDVSCLHPTILIKGGLIGLLVIHVAEHDDVPPDHNLPDLPRPQRDARDSVPDLTLV